MDIYTSMDFKSGFAQTLKPQLITTSTGGGTYSGQYYKFLTIPFPPEYAVSTISFKWDIGGYLAQLYGTFFLSLKRQSGSYYIQMQSDGDGTSTSINYPMWYLTKSSTGFDLWWRADASNQWYYSRLAAYPFVSSDPSDMVYSEYSNDNWSSYPTGTIVATATWKARGGFIRVNVSDNYETQNVGWATSMNLTDSYISYQNLDYVDNPSPSNNSLVLTEGMYLCSINLSGQSSNTGNTGKGISAFLGTAATEGGAYSELPGTRVLGSFSQYAVSGNTISYFQISGSVLLSLPAEASDPIRLYLADGVNGVQRSGSYGTVSGTITVKPEASFLTVVQVAQPNQKIQIAV